MSAVAALWWLDGCPDAGVGIARMLAALRPYGPDRDGRWDGGAVALGHCGMTLLPEDRFDRQPVLGQDGAVRLVASVRLDNRSELAAKLGISVERVPTMADSAFLLAAYERWGEDCVDHLLGDFAFIVWDGGRRRLFAARDQLGQYPLFVYRHANLLAIASMPKGLLALPEIPRQLDDVRIAAHLALLPTDTLYRDIDMLPPGHCLSAGPNHHQIRRYWRLDPKRRVVLGSDGEYAEAMRGHLTEAVRCRLRSTRPVGCELSSGCDSTSVAVTAARLQAEQGGGITAFTAVPRPGFDGPVPDGWLGDEGPGAALVAARWPNMVHKLVPSGGRHALDELDLAGLVYDAPVRNPANHVWIHAVQRSAAAQGIGVMLDGVGGNGTLSYDGRQVLPGLLRRGRLISWLRLAMAYGRQGDGVRAALRISVIPLLPSAVWRWWRRVRHGCEPGLGRHSPIVANFAAATNIEAVARDVGYDLDYQPMTDSWGARTVLLARCNTARYDAGMRAAFRIDRRHPLSDVRLVEFCLAIPDRQYLLAGRKKSLFQRTMAAELPPEILNGVLDKGYQGADWFEGLNAARGEIMEELDRLENSPLAQHCLDLPRLRQLVKDWPAGDWDKARVSISYRQALLRGVATGRFIRRFEGGNG